MGSTALLWQPADLHKAQLSHIPCIVFGEMFRVEYNLQTPPISDSEDKICKLALFLLLVSAWHEITEPNFIKEQVLQCLDGTLQEYLLHSASFTNIYLNVSLGVPSVLSSVS